MKKVSWILLLALTAGCTCLFGFKDQDRHFKRLSVEDGLSQNIVAHVSQDSQGFMWFCTDEGLNRYDGYGFKIFNWREDRSFWISHNRVSFILEDTPGNFWVGTLGGGLNYFVQTQEKFVHFRNSPTDPHSLSNDSIRVVFRDRDGGIWIGTDNGLNKYDRQRSGFIRYLCASSSLPFTSSGSITSILQDAEGILWLGTYQGLVRFDPKNETWRQYKTKADEIDLFNHNRINCVFADGPGLIWLATEAGLIQFNRASGQFVISPGAEREQNLYRMRLNDIVQDHNGQVWIAGEAGLFLFSDSERMSAAFARGSAPTPYLQNIFVISIWEDRSGIIWAGTYTGLYKHDPHAEKFTTLAAVSGSGADDPGVPVFSVHQDPSGYLWLGTYKQGLVRVDPDRKESVTFYPRADGRAGLQGNTVLSLYQDRNRRLWIGTNNGLDTYDLDRQEFISHFSYGTGPLNLSEKYVSCIFEDSRGRIWIGTQGGGVNRFDRQTRTFAVLRNDPRNPTSISNDTIMAICEDRSGYLWFGTYGGGLNRLDPQTGIFTCYRHRRNDPISLSNDKIYSLHIDSKDRFWIGTNSGGLNRFFPQTGQFIHFTRVSGLPNNVIFAILEDKSGNLWLSTNLGISCFNPETYSFRNYSVKDGLPGNEFFANSCYQTPRGEMFFGSFNGLAGFFPETVKENEFVPPVTITQVSILNRNLSIDGPRAASQRLVLSHRDSTLRFEFAALCFAAPERNQYIYRIDGLDDDWINLGNRHELVISNIRPGNYVFRVRGSNNDGVWNNQDFALPFRITPPFWQTWWFKALWIAVLIGLALAWHLTRLKRLARQIKTETAMKKFCQQYGISDRECEIIELLLKGKSNKEIENELFISLGTVKNHIYNIFLKLHVDSRAQLTALFKNIQLK